MNNSTVHHLQRAELKHCMNEPAYTTFCPESSEKIRRKASFLDDLVRCGETFDEIECDVGLLAKLVIPVFEHWLSRQPLARLGRKNVRSHATIAHAFIRFIYLSKHPRRVEFFKVPKNADKRFLRILREETGIDHPLFGAFVEVSVALFREFVSEVEQDQGH